jgi:hypothetical protein
MAFVRQLNQHDSKNRSWTFRRATEALVERPRRGVQRSGYSEDLTASTPNCAAIGQSKCDANHSAQSPLIPPMRQHMLNSALERCESQKLGYW